MEQQLINAFMKFTAKAGAGQFIKDLIQQTDENGNPKIWSSTEMQKAIEFLNHQTETFGREEALTVINTLIYKFEINGNELQSSHDNEPMPETSGIQGLQ